MNVRPWDQGVASVACMGHVTVNGDRALVGADVATWRALVVDVSGHGRAAHAEAERVVTAGLLGPHSSPAGLMLALHALLAGTVGAAAMAVEVRWHGETAEVSHCGVGNVQLWLSSGRDSVAEGQPGLLGVRLPRQLQVTARPLQHADRLAIVTDGVRREGRVLLNQAAPSAHALATAMIHQFAKIHDDATCVALQLWRPA